MNNLDVHFKAISDYVIANKDTMEPAMKDSIVVKCRNILVRMGETDPLTTTGMGSDENPDGSIPS